MEPGSYYFGGTMSLAIIPTVDKGEDWETTWPQIEYARKGMLGLSLTNYDNDSLPQIASGSWVEVAGSIYKATSNESISGSPTSDSINYIKMVPGGSGDTAYVTPTWTTSAPTWSDAYQGWYDGTSRYVAGCFYDGTNYKLKFIYFDRDCGIEEQYCVPELSERGGAGNSNDYGSISLGTNDTAFLHITLPHKAVITELRIWTSASLGTNGVRMRRGSLTDNSFDEMAQVTDTGADTSISYPEVDRENYYYWFRIDSATTQTIYGIRVKYVTAIHRKEGF